MRRRLLNAVRQQIVPSLQNQEEAQVILGEPPFFHPESIKLDFHSGKPLSSAEGKHTYASPGVVNYWPRIDVHSNRFAYMGFVLEGDIDLKIGITTQMAKRVSKENDHSDFVTLHLSQGTFFLMPPGIPYASGQHRHWQDSNIRDANFEVFWIRFQPSGVQCHLSYNDGVEKVSEPNLYLPNSRLHADAQTLIEELRQTGDASTRIIHTLLLLISYTLERGLEQLLTEDLAQIPLETFSEFTSFQPVEQACRYIESHYNQKLRLETIAASAFVSEGHLSRLFRAAKGMSVVDYITQFRLNYACVLLKDTKMQIKAIGRNVGYQNSSYFCQVFERHFACSPSVFRKKAWINKG